MAIVDMPLEELQKYRGISPRPADFDAYWDRALSELDRQDMSYRLERASFTAPGVSFFDLWFTGVGGAKLHAKFCRPEHIEDKIPAIALFHGYTGNCGSWFSKLPYAQSGVAIAALDVRGQFGLSDDPLVTTGETVRGHIIRGVDDENPDKLFYRNAYLDTVQLVRILMSMDFIDKERIGVRGDSQGGALTLACAALEPRVKKAAAWYPFLCDFRRIQQLFATFDGAYFEIGHYFRQKDPRHLTEDRFFERLGYIDIVNLAPRIQAEVKLFTGLSDVICPPSTQFAAYNNMTCKKSHELYPEFGHEYLPQADDIIYQMMLSL